MFTVMQQTTMSLKFLYFHLVPAMASKKSVILDLSSKVKMIEASERNYIFI
jgi:hypothetical protein